VAPGGQRFLLVRDKEATSTASRVVVAPHWASELSHRAPANREQYAAGRRVSNRLLCAAAPLCIGIAAWKTFQSCDIVRRFQGREISAGVFFAVDSRRVPRGFPHL